MKLRFIYIIVLSLLCANALAQDTSDEDYYNVNTVSPQTSSVTKKRQEVTTKKIKQTTPKIKQAPEKAKAQVNFEGGLAYYFGVGEMSDISFELGCRINSYFYLGAGTGIIFYHKNYTFPVFVDARWYMQKRSVTPYLDFKVGYSEFLLYNPSIGITQKVGQSTNLNLSLGLAVQHYIESYYPLLVYGVEVKLGVELY